jgi:hypothetical protein
MRRTGLALAACVLLHAAAARARTPETAVDPRGGIWLAQDDKFIFNTLDRWSVFSAGATVNKLVVDQSILWIATDDGVIRFDVGSQKSTKLTMDDGLPSQRVSTVAFDDQYVWFGTNKGLVRYRKLDRTLKVYDESNGLPSQAITYSVAVGRQVWFGTRAGIAVYSPDVDGLRGFGEADGLASGDVAEVFQFSGDLWCRTDVGLSRFRIQQRVFTNFPMTTSGATQIRVMAIDGQNLWLGTDNGLWQFEGASDAIRIFPQQDALGSRMIVGVEPGSSYTYIITDKEILQYNKLTLGIRRFTAAEGLRRQEGSTGSLSSDQFVTVLFADGAVLYDVKLDQWTERSLSLTATSGRKTNVRLFGQLELEQPFVNGDHDTTNSYATAIGGIGFGRQLEKDRSVNGSVYMDYGQLNAGGIRDLQYKIEYLGNQNDVVRDVRIEDKLKYRYIEEGLDRQLLMQGVHVGLASAGAEPKVKLAVDAGFRRGQLVRDFLSGPWQEIYQLSQKYILPGSERVYVDGELLNNGTDYTVIYPTGQLTFLNRERIDDLSVITVEYERDLMPKKSLGKLSLQQRLPASNEIGTWTLSGTPSPITTDTGLFNQIDGAAPKYIANNWVASVYATYQQAGGSIQVAIHDMGTQDFAETMFNIDLPVSKLVLSSTDPAAPGGARPDAVVDLGLPAAYKAIAFTEHYYIEVSIDDRSDAALVYLKTFTLFVLNRGKLVTANIGDTFKEALVAARGAVAPVSGMELGARVVQLQQTTNGEGDPTGARLLHLTSGMVDGRYQTNVGEGGLLTSYAEVGASHDANGGRPDGMAGMGFVRMSSARLEGSVSARVNSENWTPIGHTTPTADSTGTVHRTYNDARLGVLRDQTQFNVTGYPAEWLPVTALFTRQNAYLTDGNEGTGMLQHAIARVQLNKAGLPATTLQIGSTEVDNPSAFQVHRLQGSAQTDYDLAPLLSFTHIKRFNVRALYSLSQSETDRNDTYQYGDRVTLVRLEGKLSPTMTESVNALFRLRDVGRQTDADGPYWRSIHHWELLSGAQSTIIPGLVPRLAYNIFYDDCRVDGGCTASGNGILGTTKSPVSSVTDTPVYWSNTGPAGSAQIPPGPPGSLPLVLPGKSMTGSVGGSLGIYPGQWFPKLTPLALVPSLVVGDTESSDLNLKTKLDRVYDYVFTEVWAGRKFEMMLYQRYRYTASEADQHQIQSMTMLQNRLVYRPIFSSPITLIANYEGDRSRNDPSVITKDVGPWAAKQTHFDQLEWLMRWNQVVTTRMRLKGSYEHTSDTVASVTSQTDPSGTGQTGTTTPTSTTANYSKVIYGGELQVRFYPLQDVSALFVYLSAEYRQHDQSGDGSYTAWEVIPESGVIWRLGDKLYLYAKLPLDYKHCLSGADTACETYSKFTPYVFFTMNL